MCYSSVVKVTVTLRHNYLPSCYKGGENGGNVVCREGSLHGKRDIRSALRCNFSSFLFFLFFFLSSIGLTPRYLRNRWSKSLRILWAWSLSSALCHREKILTPGPKGRPQ